MKLQMKTLGLGVVIGLALMLMGWAFWSRSYTYQGSLINPPVPAADFQLTDQNGQPFRLSDQRGKVVLIFFGYTHCPDVCPITLTQYKQVKTALGDQAQNVRFVFVTVDPQRDTPDILRTHLANFDPAIIGLTGSQADMTQVWKDYGVYQAIEEATQTGQSLDYVVDHTSRIYAIDKNGNWRLTYPFGMEVQKLEQDVTHLIRE